MKLRIGIDVGGTFTHAVAVNNSTLEIISVAVTPTTHSAKEGVAAGVVKVFEKLLENFSKKEIDSPEIIFVAHSTTQATNALLEGDVSSVGIIAIATGLEGVKAKSDANIPPIEVAPSRFIKTEFVYLDTSSEWKSKLAQLISGMKESAIGCIVAAEPFSVDDPSNELFIKQCCLEQSVPSCGTFEMSGLYGLRMRAKTAVINASILPKMVETANMTEKGLRQSSTDAPLMVMRSDGGVMSVDEMRRRPLLTLLSGPAAGIAAALTYIRATDAVFLETGGTSTDITVIKGGRAAIRSAVIGGHTTYMKTLDSRTVGIAGGSMIQLDAGKIKTVGPRSAHIAGLKYVSFTKKTELGDRLKVIEVKPIEGDPCYLAVENENGDRFTVTTTCAANFLGFIKQEDYAFGNSESIAAVFKVLSDYFAKSAEDVACEIMDKASEQIVAVIKDLIKDYELSGLSIRLIGGGGGCYAIVPYLARSMKLDYELAKNAEVISAIGAAMAMLRDTVEKNIFNPKPQDIELIRSEASKSVLEMGASPDSIEVHVEVDSQKNIVRAIATGSIEFKSQDLLVSDVGPEERVNQVAVYFSVKKEQVEFLADTSSLFIYKVTSEEKKFFNLFKSKKTLIAVSDAKGSLKQQIPAGVFYSSSSGEAASAIKAIMEKHREYGDAGAITKGFFLIASHRITDLTSVGDEAQILSLAAKEIELLKDEDKVYFIAV